MTNTTKNKRIDLKQVMTYGAIIGGVVVLLSLLVYISGQYGNSGLGLIIDAIFIGGLIYSIKHYRENVLNGAITYGKCVYIGVLVSMFAGFLMSAYLYLLLSYDTQLREQTFTAQEEMMLQFGMDEYMVEEQMQRVRENWSPIKTAISGAFSFGFIGLILSLVAGIFLQRKPNPFANEPDDINNTER